MSDKIIKELAKTIKKRREELNITHYQMMYNLIPPVHTRSIKQFEAGKSVNLKTFLTILEHLDLEIVLKEKKVKK